MVSSIISYSDFVFIREHKINKKGMLTIVVGIKNFFYTIVVSVNVIKFAILIFSWNICNQKVEIILVITDGKSEYDGSW